MIETYEAGAVSTAPANPASAWFLVGQFGQNGDEVFYPIQSFPFSIGRRADSSLSLPYPTVSSNHAEIVSSAGGLLLRDLNSTNGTFLNGQRVKSDAVLRENDLVQFANVALRVRRQNQGLSNPTVQQQDVYDQALALVQLEKLLNERAVVPNYQPIVDIQRVRTVGYEVLGRSRLCGVETPGAMFRAAAQLNLEVQLSNMLRWEGIRHSSSFAEVPHLFVNTHPAELTASGLVESLRAVRDVNPDQPLTLEIHEAAVSELDRMRELKALLRDLNIRLAYDDFGAGQARLVELIEVRPDYLKFDTTLIRGLDAASAQRQRTVSSLVKIVRDLGVVPLAEGVETEAESRICQQLGFELGQGFHYGRPAPATSY